MIMILQDRADQRRKELESAQDQQQFSDDAKDLVSHAQFMLLQQ